MTQSTTAVSQINKENVYRIDNTNIMCATNPRIAREPTQLTPIWFINHFDVLRCIAMLDHTNMA